MHREQFRIPRQRLIRAGLALAASALAACTTYGKKLGATSNPVAAPTASGAAPETGSPAAKVIAKTSDVPVGSGVIINDIVLTQPSAGVFKGLSPTCTHAGCTVSEVAGGTINCPCHGSKYNLDGSVAKGPASRPLDTEIISVQGTSIVRG
jgi:Rieske Fe-S protein